MIPIVDEIHLARPGVPFGKERPRARVMRRKGGGPTFAQIRTPTKTRDIEAEIGLLARERGVTLPDDSLAVTVDVVACWPWLKAHSKRKREALRAVYGHLVPKITNPDPDNVWKLIADALEGIAYSTDGRVWNARAVTVFGDVAESRIRITYGGWHSFPAVWW